MTKIKFVLFTLLCAFITLQTTSCSNDDTASAPVVPVTVTGISLDKTTLTLKVGTTGTLGAMLTPVGVTGNISWSSSDSAIATVNNSGLVTGLKVGTATIAASIGVHTATCVVTVTDADVIATDDSLSGSDYYVVVLDETSFTSIKSKVIYDLRPDELTKNLYVWDGTFKAGTVSGPNFYGLSQGWVSLQVDGAAGWSGAGFNVNKEAGAFDMTAMFKNPADYYLHIGFKTSQADKSFLIILNDGNAEAKFAIGGDFNDAGTIYKSLAPLTSDGKWNSIEIPVSKLNTLGLFFEKPLTDKNVVAFLAGGTKGTTVDLDAVFYYKKAKK